MGTFKKFLNEDDELLNQILDMLLELSEDEIDDFGYFLYTEFFEDDPTDDEEDEPFDLNDVIEMIKVLGPDMYEYIIDMLEEDDNEEDDNEEDEIEDEIEDEDEIEEAVSRMMKSKNMNRKKRKFMRLSKATLRRTKAIRKRKARKTMSKRKRYYRANKVRIASYQKSRAKAIKKGKHFKKLRKRNG